MSFQCQKFSYLRQFVSKVISCQAGKYLGAENYEVILEDTIFFPEGGGQPSDRGKLGGIEVLDIERRGGQAIHYLPQPLAVGQEVEMIVDWKRRHDHMQQHSGQHLITAIADTMYGFKTTSWNLAIGLDNKCFIELATPKLTVDQMYAIEDRCNECIRQCIPMTPRWLEPDSDELKQIRSRGLPDDVVGKVRVVDIEGIDSNMCCGTHVNNLSDIQVVKLLYTENKKGATILYYIAGDRVINYLRKSVQTERNLVKLLCVGPDEHCETVDKVMKTQRQQTKVIKTQLKELAQLIAFHHIHTVPFDQLAMIHKDEGDNGFMNTIASELVPHGVLVFVSTGDKKGSGQYLLAGEESIVNEMGPKVSELLKGKGGPRKGIFQGKSTDLSGLFQVEKLLRDKLKAIGI